MAVDEVPAVTVYLVAGETTVGVPEMTPVCALIESPAGNAGAIVKPVPFAEAGTMLAGRPTARTWLCEHAY